MNYTRLNDRLLRYDYNGYVYYSHWCPACGHTHTYVIGGNNWQFNGNVDAPSFTPSMRAFRPKRDSQPETTLCHYILTDGVINYCGDSPHQFAGQSVPLPPIPEEYGFGQTAFKDIPCV